MQSTPSPSSTALTSLRTRRAAERDRVRDGRAARARPCSWKVATWKRLAALALHACSGRRRAPAPATSSVTGAGEVGAVAARRSRPRVGLAALAGDDQVAREGSRVASAAARSERKSRWIGRSSTTPRGTDDQRAVVEERGVERDERMVARSRRGGRDGRRRAPDARARAPRRRQPADRPGRQRPRCDESSAASGRRRRRADRSPGYGRAAPTSAAVDACPALGAARSRACASGATLVNRHSSWRMRGEARARRSARWRARAQRGQRRRLAARPLGRKRSQSAR